MKKIIIVGASSGIGYALAEALASRGVPVGLAARRTHRLEELKKRYPGNVSYISMDITRPTAVERLNLLIEETGGMDIYIHVAGIGNLNPELDPEKEVNVIDTNVVGFARMTSAAYRYFRNLGKPGQIAAVTSVAGTKGMGAMTAYSASKAFDRQYLVALEQLAHMEKVDVSFTDLRPGWVRTPLVEPDKEYPMEMTVEEVLPQVLRAIVKKKRVATIDWRWALLCAGWQLLPDALWTKMEYKV